MPDQIAPSMSLYSPRHAKSLLLSGQYSPYTQRASAGQIKPSEHSGARASSEKMATASRGTPRRGPSASAAGCSAPAQRSPSAARARCVGFIRKGFFCFQKLVCIPVRQCRDKREFVHAGQMTQRYTDATSQPCTTWVRSAAASERRARVRGSRGCVAACGMCIVAVSTVARSTPDASYTVE